MRYVLTILLFIAMPSLAQAAPSSWLDDLFGPNVHHPAVHRPVHAAPAAEAKPAAPVPLAPLVKPADTTPPMPLPRPVAPPPTPEPATAKPDAVAPVPEAPAANAPVAPAAAPQSTAPVAVEGESTAEKPPRVYQTACPAVITGLVEAKPLPPIADGMCQEQSPLEVTGLMVNGRMLPMTAPATFNCQMASTLPGWVADVDNYLQATQKTRIKAVMVGQSYSCRNRNVAGGSSDLSEHGRADALDFVGFALEDGRKLTVTDDYNSADPVTSRAMHFAHDVACTRFTTVLGPEANADHHDHFHLDLGCHGKTCTFRLCE
jgi:hypothetical protein